MRSSVEIAGSLEVSSAQAMERAARSLLSRQHEDGYWWGNLTADTTLEAVGKLGTPVRVNAKA